jgi:hypothetical protein
LRRLRTGLIRLEILHKLSRDVEALKTQSTLLKTQSTQQRRRISSLESDNTTVRAQLDHVLATPPDLPSALALKKAIDVKERETDLYRPYAVGQVEFREDAKGAVAGSYETTS